MKKIKIPYKDLRVDFYDYIYSSLDSSYTGWNIKNLYKKLKSIYYVEVGLVLLYFIVRTKIHPNSITLLYALIGILGLLLFINDSVVANYIALFLFFSKSIPDWIDGYLAKIKGCLSEIGALLDTWGARVNSIAFQLGISVFASYSLNNQIFTILGCAIVFLKSIDFYDYYSAFSSD